MAKPLPAGSAGAGAAAGGAGVGAGFAAVVAADGGGAGAAVAWACVGGGAGVDAAPGAFSCSDGCPFPDRRSAYVRSSLALAGAPDPVVVTDGGTGGTTVAACASIGAAAR